MHELHQQPGTEAEAASPDAVDSSARIVTSIRQAARLLDDLLAVDFSNAGVNNTRFAALRFIGQSTHEGCSQRELAAALGQSESSISGLVSRMRADGLVYRLRSKRDQRKRQLMLSAQGREMLADCEVSYQKHVEDVLNRFEPTWLEEFSHMLDVLVNALTGHDQNEEIQPKRSEEPIRRSA